MKISHDGLLLNIFTKIWRFTLQWGYILCPGILLALLLCRNPFSERTLIPNFEPFPDSFYYVTVPRCFLSGQGWTLCREEFGIPSHIGPLYSVYLLPWLSVSDDPRIFYFANVLLSFIAFFLVVFILKKLEVKNLLSFFVLIVFVTNHYISWFPTLAMAEHLLLVIFLMSLILLQVKVTPLRVFLASITSLSFYLTKNSAAPLLVSFSILYLIKIWLSEYQKLPIQSKLSFRSMVEVFQQKTFWLQAGLFISSVGGLSIVFFGQQLFESFLSVLTSVFPGIIAQSNQAPEVTNSSWAFSIQFFPKHFPAYFQILFGHSEKFLWKTTPLIPSWLAFVGIAGTIISLIRKRHIFLIISGVVLVISQVLFMSIFYVVDARYLYIAFPVMIIFFALFLKELHLIAQKKKLSKAFQLGTLFIAGLYLLSQTIPLKNALALNFKHAEIPWWYIASRDIDLYLSSLPESSTRKILVTSIPPYLYDYYASGKVELLPLSYDHDLRDNRATVFGNYSYSSLVKLYQQFLEQGREVYVTNYGLGNEQPRHQDFAMIQQNFHLELVRSGCHEACNLWRLTEKTSTLQEQQSTTQSR